MGGQLEGWIIAHEDAAGRLLNQLESGGPRGLELARAHVDGCAELDDAQLSARGFTLAEAEDAYARRLERRDWVALRLEVMQQRGVAPGAYGAAQRALTARDEGVLAQVLASEPRVVQEVHAEHGTLLSLAVGMREVEGVARLLAAGADVTVPAPCGCTPLHRAGYGHPPEANPGPQSAHVQIIKLLTEVGAATDVFAHREGGTPLAMALFWGHAVLADLLGEPLTRKGARVPNLRTAAALGLVDSLDGFFEGLQPRAAAGAERGFYRPHDDFPVWKPSGEPQELLDEAFVWALRNGRLDTAQVLLERGAALDGCPYDVTALHAVASRGPDACVDWLLARGASVDEIDHRGGTPLHAAAVMGRLATVKRLLEHGADPTRKDTEFSSTPSGYAQWAGCADVVDTLAAPTSD